MKIESAKNFKFGKVILILSLVLLLCVTLVACNDAEDYQKKLAKKGYDVKYIDTDLGENLEWRIEAKKGDYKLYIAKFNTRENAEYYFDKVLIHMVVNPACKFLIDTVVMYGSEQAIRDAN